MKTKPAQKLRAIKTPVIKLTPEDLQEWGLRRTTLNNAKFQALMVEEAYAVWARNLRARYDIPTAKFDIDPHTGVVTPKEDTHV